MESTRPRIFCDSCGMRMEGNEDHGGGDILNPHCKNCCDSEGKLKSKEEIKEILVKFYVEKYDYPKTAAEKLVDNFMNTMPAWKK